MLRKVYKNQKMRNNHLHLLLKGVQDKGKIIHLSKKSRKIQILSTELTPALLCEVPNLCEMKLYSLIIWEKN